jgi:hypothetical protein
MRRVLLLLCFMCTALSALSAPRPRQETILGRVVAYSVSPACLNGNGNWALVIRVQRPKDGRSQFIRVDFTLPCRARPAWLGATPPIHKFQLFRQKNCDEVLVGPTDDEPKKTLNLPHWEYLRGIEPHMLPFGQVVPCYSSADPVEIAPVL